MKFLLPILSIIFVAIQFASSLTLLPTGTITVIGGCKTNDDCGQGSCCINTNYLIMSKKDLLPGAISLPSLLNNGGTCQKYTRKGEDCYASFNTCGCELGTTCTKVADLPVDPSQSKLVILRPPGIYQCV